MSVHCPECEKSVALPPERVAGGIPKARCPYCGCRFEVFGDGTTITLPSAGSGGTLEAGTTNAPQSPGDVAAPNFTIQGAALGLAPANAAGGSAYLLDAPELDIGRHFRGKYRIDAVIGRGGSAIVYRAHDLDAEIDRALKVVGTVGGGADGIRRAWAEEYKARLQVTDGTHLLGLESPLVEEIEGTTYVALPQELGQSTLRDWLKGKKHAIAEHREEALRLFAQVCRGVEVLHNQDIAHLDLKPENVLLFDDGGQWTAKVGDFGLARAAGGLQRREGVGTPQYMAPEQVRAAREKDIGPWSDIYALGCILFELLDGDAPFTGSTEELKDKHFNMAPPELEGVPARLESLVMACLAKSRKERPLGAKELVEFVNSDIAPSVDNNVLESQFALVDIRVPELPETTVEAKIVSLQAEVGQRLNRGDPVLEIETERAIIQIEAKSTGVLERIFTQNAAPVNEDRLLGQIKCIVFDQPPFDAGDIVKGVVDNILDFCVFVEIKSSNSAMVHISEIASPPPDEVTDVLEEGLHVYVRIISIDGEGRIQASMLGVSQPPRFIEAESAEAKFVKEGDVRNVVVQSVREMLAGGKMFVVIKASTGNFGRVIVDASDSGLGRAGHEA
ncbi:protein kinase domain-containing protein, partial [Roseovarius sp.]|uniref:protein kinase domain-containing protein n=1 Tax=Roseovarius sp. TaxID=1486281 RepID=UPI0035684B27